MKDEGSLWPPVPGTVSGGAADGARRRSDIYEMHARAASARYLWDLTSGIPTH